jgi:hypothetical protein
MANMSDIDKARAERFAAELLDAFVARGAHVVRNEDVGDPELWRATARKVAHEHGYFVVTGYYGPKDELVWASLFDHPPTDAERSRARAAVDEAVVIAGGQMLSQGPPPETTTPPGNA